MASNPPRKSTKVAAFALLLLGATGLVALGVYVRNTPQVALHRDRQAPPAAHSEQGAPPRTEVVTATIFTPTAVGTDLKLTGTTMNVPDGDDPIVFVVNRFLDEAKVTSADARVLTCTVRGAVAYLDFSDAFAQSYGAFDERTLLRGICVSVGQFSNVDQVQFEVGGKPLDTIGNVELSNPIPVIRDPDAPDTSSPEGAIPPNAPRGK